MESVCNLESLETSIKNMIEKAEDYLVSENLNIELVYDAPIALLQTISDRSKALPSLYFTSVEMLQQRLQNGCYLLKKDDEVVGHIFAHKHMINEHAIYERASLWVKKEYRTYNLGLLLMKRLTDLYKNNFVISIASEPIVHNNNELLGMKFITLSKMSNVLVTTLEKIGKLRDELKYKYYVNPCLELEIGELQ